MWQLAALIGAGLGLWKSEYGAEGINKKLCVLCKKYYGRYGHNAEPLAKGRCCDACNEKVIAARMAMYFGAEIEDATSEVIPPTPPTSDLIKKGYMGTGASVQGYVTDWIPATWNAESVIEHKRGKVISMRGSDPRLRTLRKDKDISPKEARDRLEISAENWAFNFPEPEEISYDDARDFLSLMKGRIEGANEEGYFPADSEDFKEFVLRTMEASFDIEFDAETFNAAVLHKKPKGYVGKAVAMDALMTQARIEEAMLQLETAVKLGLISEDEIMEKLQQQFGSEEYAGNYMVPADIKSLARSVKVLQSKARADQNQPEWWKSKLSVVAAELDDLTDFFDYAEDTGML